MSGRVQLTTLTIPQSSPLGADQVTDDVCVPAFRVASRYEEYFRSTMVTDELGNLTETIAEFGVSEPAGPPSARLPATFSPDLSEKEDAATGRNVRTQVPVYEPEEVTTR